MKATCWVVVCNSSTINTNSNQIIKVPWGIIQQANAH